MGSGEYGHIHVSVAENGEAVVAHAYLGHAVRAEVCLLWVLVKDVPQRY